MIQGQARHAPDSYAETIAVQHWQVGTVKKWDKNSLFECEINVVPQRGKRTVQMSIRGRNRQKVQSAERYLTQITSFTFKSMLIYMDLNNFIGEFIKTNWNLTEAVERADLFVTQLERQTPKAKLVLFVDGFRGTDEASRRKYMSRRLKEVKRGERFIPLNSSWILVSAFVRHGVEIRYSVDNDLDTTLAYFAYKDGALVLSTDRGFFGYRNETNLDELLFPIIHFSFRHNNEARPVVFYPAPPPDKAKLRIKYLPKVDPLYNGFDDNHSISRTMENLGGTPTALIRRMCSNPHIVIRPLRLAVYAKQLKKDKLKEPVTERFPIWSEEEQNAVFTEDLVYAETSTEMEDLLLTQHPKVAYAKYFPKEAANPMSAPDEFQDVPDLIWQRHCMGCHSVVVEQYAFYNSCIGKEFSYRDHMIEWQAEYGAGICVRKGTPAKQ